MQLLGFADAVGTSRGLLRVLLPKTPALRVAVQVQDATHVLDLTQDFAWGVVCAESPLICLSRPKDTRIRASDEVHTALEQKVAAELEALLFLAYKLQLPDLQQQVVNAVRRHAVTPERVLYRECAVIVSDRLIQAVPDISRHSLTHGLVAEPCPLVAGDGPRQLLRPVGQDKPKLSFQAEVLHNFLGFKPGETVQVELDLLGQFRITAARLPRGDSKVRSHPVQLLLGAQRQWPF